ncbi:MAG: HYR domain-containing protein [Planctomycetes bacterium]|nr:HYR domain-containing protein [Planctomycetota bacterium]
MLPRLLAASGLSTLAVLAVSAHAQTSFPEAEPNGTKSEATPALGLVAGDFLTGTTTGSATTAGSALSTTADTFRVRTAPLPPGIYRHRLTITTGGTAGHTGTVRGLTQSGTVGVGGTPNPTSDTTIQTTSTATTPPRMNVWYGFGAEEELYWRITGTSTTTAAYVATLGTDVVTPTSIATTFLEGPITISTVGQTSVDTEIFVYDASFVPIPGYLNDDESPGTSLQSRITRTFTPGTYYVAVGTSNTASNQTATSDDRFVSGALLDFGGGLVRNSSSTAAQDFDFSITDSSGTTPITNQLAAGNPYTVTWHQFTVVANTATPPNDECTAAIPLSSGTVTGSTAFATHDGVATCDLGAGLSKDVWYRYTAAWPVYLTASTCGSASDTVLSLHDACGGTELDCNDDCGGAPCGGPAACVSRLLASGESVLVRVASGAGAGGSFSLTLAVTPVNDACSAAFPLTIPGTVSGATTGATAESPLPPACAGPSGSGTQNFTYTNGVWYALTHPVTETVVLDTLLSSSNTKLWVFDASAGCSALVCVTANDDIRVSPNTSKVAFVAQAGTPYLVLVGPSSNATPVEFTLRASSAPTPANDDCSAAIPLAGLTGSLAGTTTGATASVSGSWPSCMPNYGYFDVWYAYTNTAACLQTLTVDTCGGYDSTVSFHSACQGPFSSNQIGGLCNDSGGSGCTPGARVSGFIDAGQTVYVRVGVGVGAAPGGDFTLRWTLADTTPPALQSCPQELVLDASYPAPAVLPDLRSLAQATDACGIATISQTPPPGTSLPLGDHAVTITFEDPSSNATDCHVLVTVRDPSAIIRISGLHASSQNYAPTMERDYVELFNPSASPIVLDGWSLQVQSGSTWLVHALTGTIAARSSFLVVCDGPLVSPGQALPLPAADDLAVLDLPEVGDVALALSTTPLPTNPTSSPLLVDWVSYGAAASDAPELRSGTSLWRRECGDRDGFYSGDEFFAFFFPSPRNAALGPVGGLSGAGTCFPQIAPQGGGTRLLLSPFACADAAARYGVVASVDLTPVGGAPGTPIRDDGTGGDDVAGDGIYTCVIPIDGATAVGPRHLRVDLVDGPLHGSLWMPLHVAAASTPANDDAAGAIEIAGPYGLGAQITGDFTGAHRESNAILRTPSAGIPFVGPTNTAMGGGTLISSVSPSDAMRRGLWYRVTGTGTTLRASTCPTAGDLDTVLLVLCGTADNLLVVAAADDAGPGCAGLAASVAWCTELGRTYYVWVAPWLGGASTDSFVLEISDLGAPCTTALPCPTCPASYPPAAYRELEPAFGPAMNAGCANQTLQPLELLPVDITTRTFLGQALHNHNIRSVDWLAFTSPTTGTFDFTLAAQFPVSVIVNQLASGSACPIATFLNAGPAGPCGPITASIPVEFGVRYVLQVSSVDFPTPGSSRVGGLLPGGSSSQYRIDYTVNGLPGNDLCFSPLTLRPGELTPAWTIGATPDGVFSSCGTVDGNDVWFAVAGIAGHDLNVSTCGAGIDTVVSIHEFCGNWEYACNDDCGGTPCGGPASCATARFDYDGQVLYIRVEDKGVPGLFEILAAIEPPAPPANDACQDALAITCPTTILGRTVGATFDGPLPTCLGPGGSEIDSSNEVVSAGVWYVVTPAVSGSLEVEVLPLDFYNPRVTVFRGACGSLVCTTANDNADILFNDGRARIGWAATGGETYRILVHAAPSESGNYQLALRCNPTPANDDCPSPQPLSGPSGSAAGTTLGATGAPSLLWSNQLASCAPLATHEDVWFAWTAPCAGTVTFATCGATDTVLSAHSACPTTSASNQRAPFGSSCNDQGGAACSPGSRITLVVQTGETLLLRVATSGFARMLDFPGGPFTLTWSLTDTVAPTLTSCAPPQSAPAGAGCLAAVPDFTSLVVASDDCGAISVTQVPAPGTLVGTPGTDVVLTVLDAAGNPATCITNFVVLDTTPPAITSCAPAQSAPAGAGCLAAVPDLTGLVVASDECGTVSVTQVPAPGTLVGAGTVEVVLTVTDTAGNPATCSTTFSVLDTTPPEITSCAPAQSAPAGAGCSAAVPDLTGLVVASDECGTVSVTQVPAPGTLVGAGTIEVVLTVTDAAGNPATCSTTFSVLDTTPPEITCPAPLALSAGPGCLAALPDLTSSVGVIDCGPVTLSQSPAAGTLLGLGGTIVTLTALDASGNSSACEVLVDVADVTPPEVTACATRLTIPADTRCQSELPDLRAGVAATDTCSSVTIEQNPPPGAILGLGATLVVLTITDEASNVATCSVWVTTASPDSDADGVVDCLDGCPADPLKTDPGACGCGVSEDDPDGDGVPSCIDNCDALANPTQDDGDADGVGDACDNCPAIPNADQADCDLDGLGDLCAIAAGAPDCNLNGIPDGCDVAGLASPDANANGIPDECEILGGTPFCFGESACPCGNDGPPGSGAGCVNSTGAGARLTGSGLTSLSADGLALDVVGLPPAGFATFFQASLAIDVPFGDGRRCANGTIVRLATKPHAGSSSYPALTEAPVSVRGQLVGPGVQNYQVWYRNPAGPCGTGWNLSNALSVIWIP